MAPSLAAVKAVFDRALEIESSGEREAFLAEACAGDVPLRQKVDALLKAYADAGSFLDPAPPAAAATATFGPDAGATADFPGTDERVGAMIGGRYKLVEAIGAGGMGAVYLAQQTEPLKRAVAVKVVKAGMDSKAVLARFEAERQALALMDHPNIAKVLDAGTTEGGRPYFVMELVKGVPITQFCDERKLTPRQRLELFIPVCQAIQHAHQKGVIHRDVKPSNVLVALYDDRPVPKVIDFGIAKAVGPALTDATLMTGFGAVVGTPEYMSPEQASLNNLDVDTRSDVYSLGVLLYELLTGSTPVDRKALGQAALLEVLRIVREVEAPRPSAKLSTLDTLPSVAANRGTEPAKLSGLLKGELDWVLLKALEKDRARRYDSAGGLARDVQRYLADEVVEARPPGAGYRVRKFVRRHKGRVLAAGLVLFALLAGLAGTTWGLVRADAARREAQAAAAREAEQRKYAEAKQAEAEAVVAFVDEKVFAVARPRAAEGGGLGPDVTVRAALVASLPALAARFADQPAVEARLRRTLGLTLIYMEEPKLAAEQLERALRITPHGPDHPDTLATAYHLAMAYSLTGRYDPTQGRDDDARRLHAETLAARRRVLGPDHPDTLASMQVVAGGFSATGRHDEALKMFEEVLAVRRRTLGPDDRLTLYSTASVAATLSDVGRHAEALKLFEESLAARRRVFGPDHLDTLLSMVYVPQCLLRMGRGAEAVPLLDECYARAAAHGEMPKWYVPQALRLRMEHFRQAGDANGCRATAEMWEKRNPADADALSLAGRYRAVASGAYAKSNRPAEAAADAERAMAWLAKAVAAGYKNVTQLKAESDYDSLRDRADFKQLLAALEEKPVPKK